MDLGNFFLVPVNYLAVLISAVLAMVVGYFWYGRKMTATPKTYTIMFISSLVMAYVLAHFIWYAAPGSLTLFISIKTAVWAWLGFVATVSFSRWLFSDEKSWQPMAVESGYYLVSLVVMGVVFALLP